MGYFSSTTKVESTSQSAPLTQEGLEYQSMVNSMMMSNFMEYGYEPVGEEKTVFDDEGKAGKYKRQISEYQADVDRLRADMEANPYVQKSNATRAQQKIEDPRVRDLKNAEAKLSGARDKLDDLPSRTYTDYTFKKKEDPRITQAKEQYGVDSAEVKAIENQIKADDVYEAEATAQITRDYLKASQKLVSGDYSYTPEQKEVAETYFGDIREILEKTTSMLLDEAEAGQKDLFGYVNKFAEEIDRTGFDVMDALNASMIQVEQSGASLMSVAETVNQKHEAKAKFEFDLLAKQADERAAQQSALLGLPPGSAVEKKQASLMKYNALQSVLLGMEATDAERKLGIAADTESGKKAISMAKVELAQSQGAKKEQLVGTGLDIAAATNQQKFGIKSAYAQGKLGIENDKMNFLFNSAVGQLPGQVAGGQGYSLFGEQLKGAQLSTNAQLMAPAMWGLGIEQQRTFADAKKTQTTTSTPSIFSAISSGIATGAGAATGIMNAMKPAPSNIFNFGRS